MSDTTLNFQRSFLYFFRTRKTTEAKRFSLELLISNLVSCDLDLSKIFSSTSHHISLTKLPSLNCPTLSIEATKRRHGTEYHKNPTKHSKCLIGIIQNLKTCFCVNWPNWNAKYCVLNSLAQK